MKRSKITLHYIWFEDYGSYKNQGVNLSTKYHFESDNNQKRIIVGSVNKDYISGFFGENIDLTTIVGANGTGKTLLLRFILDLSGGNVINTPCVVIYEVDKGFCAIRYYVDENHVIQNRPLEIPNFPKCDFIDNNPPYEKYQIRDKIRFIYLTELFNSNQYHETYAGAEDLSFAACLYEQSVGGDEEVNDNPIVKTIHRTFDKQLQLLANAQKLLSDFSIRTPKYVSAFFIFNEQAFEKMYLSVYYKQMVSKNASEKEKYKSEAESILNTFFDKNADKTIPSFLSTLSKAILINIIQSFDFVINTNPEDRNALIKMIKRVCVLPDNSWKK